MTSAQHFVIILTVVTAIGLPTLGFMVRITILWTRSQDRIAGVADDVLELAREAREDRRATNERLTWLERNAWGSRS